METAREKLNIEETGDGVALEVKVRTGAGRSCVEGVKDGMLAVSVKAAPEGGKANAEVERVVAKAAGVGAGDVKITAGRKSRRKRVRISGVKISELVKKLSE